MDVIEGGFELVVASGGVIEIYIQDNFLIGVEAMSFGDMQIVAI